MKNEGHEQSPEGKRLHLFLTVEDKLSGLKKIVLRGQQPGLLQRFTVPLRPSKKASALYFKALFMRFILHVRFFFLSFQRSRSSPKDHPRRAPDVVPLDNEVGITDADSVATAIFERDVVGVHERGDRRLDELRDLARMGAELRPGIRDADERLHEEVGHDHPERRERADQPDIARMDADLFVRLAKRACSRILARIERRRRAG